MCTILTVVMGGITGVGMFPDSSKCIHCICAIFLYISIKLREKNKKQMKFTIGVLLPFDSLKIMDLLFILKLTKRGIHLNGICISHCISVLFCWLYSASHRYTHIITHIITVNY